MKKDYRAAVGPPDKYDLIGALQFWVLVKHGLREGHKLLDIGCGSLRGGRFFIVYLKRGNYTGIEPLQHLVREGIEKELGGEIIKMRKPTFYYSGAFDLSALGGKYNYILAQSIFSHADMRQIDTCLSEVKKVLLPSGKFVFTYFLGNRDYTGTGWAQAPDATYTPEWMKAQCEGHGLTYRKLDAMHPSGQTWAVSMHR